MFRDGPSALPPSPLPDLPPTPNGHTEARRFGEDADTLFRLVADTVPEVRGWRVGKPQSIESSQEQRRIYALYRVGVFQDDVLIAIEPLSDGGAALYLRSTSRTGYSDLGVNRRRCAALLQAVEAALNR
ncbi:MAG: DUF1499 domain-containing protein [Bacteroidota bacterium]